MSKFRIPLIKHTNHGTMYAYPVASIKNAQGNLVLQKMLLRAWQPNWELIEFGGIAEQLLNDLGKTRSQSDTQQTDDFEQAMAAKNFTSECPTVADAKRFLDELFEEDGIGAVSLAILDERRKTVLKHADKLFRKVEKNGNQSECEASAEFDFE